MIEGGDIMALGGVREACSDTRFTAAYSIHDREYKMRRTKAH